MFPQKLVVGCANRAVVCASAAFDALGSIDFVLSASIGDCVYGAVVCARTASDAGIVNYICHCLFLLFE